MNWSNYQNVIFEAAAKTTESLAINAVAGSGKTTTLVEVARNVPTYSDENSIFPNSILCLAFGREIAKVLDARMNVVNPSAQVCTFHVLGLRTWGRFAPGCKLDKGKWGDVLRDPFTQLWPISDTAGIKQLASLAMADGLVPDVAKFTEEERKAWDELPKRLPVSLASWVSGIVPDDAQSWECLSQKYALDATADVIMATRRALALTLATSLQDVSFDDMLYAPFSYQVTAAQTYDVIIVDEAQDVNAIQAELISRTLVPGGRVIIAGDPDQAIMGFRGCLEDAFHSLAGRFKCRELPLSVSYRCPRAVVRRAQQYVERIEHAPSAPDGNVLDRGLRWVSSEFRAQDDVILCRNIAPLVNLRYQLREEGVPCHVTGDGIPVAAIVKLAKRTGAADYVRLESYLDQYFEERSQRWGALDSRLGALDDHRKIILTCARRLKSKGNFMQALVAEIENSLREERASSLELSTIHRAKGREWKRVFILGMKRYMPSRYATQPWQQEQERHLAYVGITRAKCELHFIDEKEG